MLYQTKHTILYRSQVTRNFQNISFKNPCKQATHNTFDEASYRPKNLLRYLSPCAYDHQPRILENLIRDVVVCFQKPYDEKVLRRRM